jgi:hypothetical protein
VLAARAVPAEKGRTLAAPIRDTATNAVFIRVLPAMDY